MNRHCVARSDSQACTQVVETYEVEERQHAEFEDVRSQKICGDVGCGDARRDYIVLYVTTLCLGLLAKLSDEKVELSL